MVIGVCMLLGDGGVHISRSSLKTSFPDGISSQRRGCGVSMKPENVGQVVVEIKRRLRFRNPQRISAQLRGRGRVTK
jgi:hypothetical protein